MIDFEWPRERRCFDEKEPIGFRHHGLIAWIERNVYERFHFIELENQFGRRDATNVKGAEKHHRVLVSLFDFGFCKLI